MVNRDKQLIEMLTLRRGEHASLAAVLQVSRQAVEAGCKTGWSNRAHMPFLNLDRLLALFLHYKEQQDERRATILREEILVRYPTLGAIVGLECRPIDQPPAFVEMWIFSARPRELYDESFTENIMKPLLEDEGKKLVYFVPDTGTGKDLVSCLREVTDSVREVVVVASPVYRMAPHFVIYFEPGHGVDDQKMVGLAATDRDLFAPLTSQNVRQIKLALREADLLTLDGRFSWPGNERTHQGDTASFELVYPRL